MRKLMDGHTNGAEEQAIKKILLGCSSRDELDKVVGLSGGWEAVADELDDGRPQAGPGARPAAHRTRQEAAVQDALGLLEQASPRPKSSSGCSSCWAANSSSTSCRRRRGPSMLGRLESLGQKNGVAGVGLRPCRPRRRRRCRPRSARAIDKGDNDAIVRLSENSEAMKAASPVEKARMIRILQDGWTKDRQDMAIARILTSCGSKAEFDQVVDHGRWPRDPRRTSTIPEAKADINKLMGGFDRLDCADDQARPPRRTGACCCRRRSTS